MFLLNFLNKILMKRYNNNVEIQRGLNVKCKIKGKNNTVKIFGNENKKIKANIRIKIYGDNNSVIINGIEKRQRRLSLPLFFCPYYFVMTALIAL